MWRVDLQRTLSVLDSIKPDFEEELQAIETMIMRCLVDLKDMDYQGGTEQSQCHQFVRAAADLASNMRQSMALYDFEFEFEPSFGVENKVLKLDDLKKHKVVDSRTGSQLRSSATPVQGLNSRVGEVLFVVHPAFVRKATDTSQKIVLAKSTIMVRFDRPVPQGGRTRS